MADQPLDDLIARLERERLEADRLYNDALTVVDRAVQRLPNISTLPIVSDETALTAVNRSWDIAAGDRPLPDRSLKGRLKAFIWRTVAPVLEGQKQFNASVADHLNRRAGADRAAHEAIRSLADEVRGGFEALVRFESLLVQYLQTITLYVDTKDRSAGGQEIRERVALTEQRLLALGHELRRSPAAAPAAATTAAGPPADDADAFKYVEFENRFRGTQSEIRRRLDDYLPILRSASDVVDIGCGRGELLDLMAREGIRARGVDSNQAMVDLCRSRGLDVELGDARGFLERQPDGSIGGLVAIQVVEHFAPSYLVRFLDAAHLKLKAGAPLVLETINPSCWMAFFECYIRDLTHVRPLHAETLRYLVQASGFTSVDIRERQPVGEADRLDRVSQTAVNDPAIGALIAAINAHADKLNARLFSSMDYALIARR